MGHWDNVHEFRQKTLENQTKLHNSTDTTRKSLIFRVLCALFEKIPSGINLDILENPTWSGATNSNKLCAPSHLVTWIPHSVSYILLKYMFRVLLRVLYGR